jgi:hypothetical protein
MLRRLLIVTAALGLTHAAHAGAPEAAPSRWAADPAFDRASVEFSSGILFKALSPDATHPYRLIPLQLTFRAAPGPVTQWGPYHVTVRHTLRLAWDVVSGGPETRYAGVVFRPTVELWDTRNPLVWHAGLGGGFGWFDTRGVPGGQGQDFTLNIQGEIGLRWRLSERTAINLSGVYQHNSNGGLKEPNPGLNTFGPTVGLHWSF